MIDHLYRHLAVTTQMEEEQQLLSVSFLGRSERLEEARLIGGSGVWRGACGIFVDALTAGVLPAGLPTDLWRTPRVDLQLALDVWFGEPDRRSDLSLLGLLGAVKPDVRTIYNAITHLALADRIRYRPGIVGLEKDELAARVRDWLDALKAGRSRISRPSQSATTIQNADSIGQLIEQLARLDPGSVALASLSQPDRRHVNTARHALAQYVRDHGRWSFVAYASDAEAAAWVEILHALRIGIPARICAFCSRYFLRVGPKGKLCRNCAKMLRRVWRKRRLLSNYPAAARAMAAPIFWSRPREVARHGIMFLQHTVAFLKTVRSEKRGR